LIEDPGPKIAAARTSAADYQNLNHKAQSGKSRKYFADPVEVVRFTAPADGKTMTVSMENKKKGTTRQFVAHKQ